MNPPLQRKKNKFLLEIPAGIYRPSSVEQAIAAAPFAIKADRCQRGKMMLELMTGDIEQALGWVNHLFYINKECRGKDAKK